MPHAPIAGRRHAEAEFASRVAGLFRRAGWQVQRRPHVGSRRADLLVRRGEHTYVVELKVASEGRRDRLVPLLAQAILEAQGVAREVRAGALPLAIVAAPRIAAGVADDLKTFGLAHGMGGGVGLVDLEGLQAFAGPGLDSLDAPRAAFGREHARWTRESIVNPFSDLNQWMLKVLLAPHVPEHLLAAPRGEYRNASELAAAAQVSLMTAFRFLRQLRGDGFLDDSASVLRLVRIEELFNRWQAASLRPVRELPARWIIRGDPKRQLAEAIGSAPSRVCLGLFAAADALGFGFVHGVPAHIYLEDLRQDNLRKMGLSLESNARPDVFLRIPSAPEAVFRAALRDRGVPASDILQVWIDAGAHPSRGHEQASLIRRRVLQRVFKSR